MVSTTTYDGLGRPISTALTSDPDNPTYTATTYDGMGKPYQIYNPTRCSSPTSNCGETTWGFSAYNYDAFGRTTTVTEPDGSAVNTSYNSNCATVTDETGRQRISCSDSLGRLTQVQEPGPGATASTFGSGTVAIGGSEQTETGTPGSGTATVQGGVYCVFQGQNGSGQYVPPSGVLTITVYGLQTVSVSANYGGSCSGSADTPVPTYAQIASTLAAELTTSAAGVTATSNGAAIQITANATGSNTNYRLSSTATTSIPSDTESVSVPASLTGGSGSGSVSDSGTVSVSVDGVNAQVSYGAGSTSSQIANSIAAFLNQGSPVQAKVNGSTITITAIDPGSSSNYTLSTSVTWNESDFANPSFTATPSGSTLTGGTDGSVGSTPFVTQYAYDALGNLLCAVQKGTDTTAFTSCASAPLTWRPRSFVYDSLSRLGTAYNPESGTTSYTYDPNGNLSSKTVPKASQTGSLKTTHNYTYDALNRLTKESHLDPNEGTELYSYDGTALTGCSGPSAPTITSSTNLIGQRTAMCADLSASSWSYDSMGRPLVEARTNKGTSAATYKTYYSYNLDGSLKTLTYPSGNVLTYTPGGAGRSIGVSDSANDYVDSGANKTRATYAPSGALTGMVNGYNSQFSGIVISNIFNSRLQPAVISASVPGGTLLSLAYDFHLGTGDNGNVFQVIDNVDSTRSVAYKYDLLNRLQQANTLNTSGANCWGETYSIDAWANLYNVSGVSGMGTCTSESLNATATTQNQLSGVGMTYDAAGNVTKDNLGNTPTYDQESRIATVGGYTYYYDADGSRTEKAAGSTGTMYWPGPGGETITETDLTGAINEEYIFFNGQRLARVDRPSGTVHYYLPDRLGSTSKIVSSGGAMQEQYYYYPYGGLQSQTGSDSNHYKFTGKERDNESGLDYFGARYDSSSLGRFMTPDTMGGHLENPQSLNKYAYVLNNPTSLTDPTGLDSYLSCTQTTDNASTCQSQTVGYDANGRAQTATVQGVTNADKSFTATLIGNQNADGTGPLVDKTTGTGTYTASANGSGVQFSNNGGQSSSTGVFVNGTPQTTFQDAGFANGNALSGFTFTLTNSKLEAGQTEAGSFTFAGTPDQAGAALQKAGFKPRSGENVGMNEYRSPGSFWTGANSAHFNVFQIGLKPWLAVPQAQGDMHFGEHDPRSVFGGPIHFREWRQ